MFLAILQEIARSGSPVGRPACLIAGGETTVTIRGSGAGGRCQEFALALVSDLAAMQDVVVLAAGTDGSDGPTSAAGAVVDPTTLGRSRGKGVDVKRALAENASHPFFSALGDLVVTGPTGSNLMDVYLGVIR
jgi:glycerate-2-kinase